MDSAFASLAAQTGIGGRRRGDSGDRALAWLYVRNGSRQKFGPEYARAVRKHGSERKAEAQLADREKQVEKLNICDLDPMEHERFSKRWESVQSRFVDSPKGAVTEADDLVSSLMKTRGYPVSDFDQRAADISVVHPRVEENYRSAHEIALRVGKNAALVSLHLVPAMPLPCRGGLDFATSPIRFARIQPILCRSFRPPLLMRLPRGPSMTEA
jgi:hypothetical protein